MQETPGLGRSHCRATKPVHHNYWARALEPGNRNYWNPCTQSPYSATREATTMRSPCTAMRSSLCSLQLEKVPAQPYRNTIIKKNRKEIMEDWKWKKKAAEGVWSVSRLALWSTQERAGARLYFLKTVCSTSPISQRPQLRIQEAFTSIFLPLFFFLLCPQDWIPFCWGWRGYNFFFKSPILQKIVDSGLVVPGVPGPLPLSIQIFLQTFPLPIFLDF